MADEHTVPGSDHLIDLVVAAGRSLVVIEGRDRRLSLDSDRRARVEAPTVHENAFPFEIRSLAIGDFRGRGRAEIALLSDDGGVHFLPNGDAEGRGTVDSWQLVELLRTAPSSLPIGTPLVPARVSGHSGDALVVADPGDGRLRVLAGDEETVTQSIRVDGGAVAVLPLQLNGDALDDLVILHRDGIAPSVALTAPLATFTVTTTSNTGAGSLRDAITQANASPGADTINFSIPGAGVKTILLSTALPSITEAVTIDATTQPGYAGTPLVVLNGSNVLTVGPSGLTLAAPNCLVKGLSIIGFRGNGILISGAGATGNIVRSCYIGVNASGASAVANGDDGIEISGGGQATIGGTVTSARNVISGNKSDGIFIDGLGGSSNNVIQGNYIGTNAAGTAAIPNGSVGGFHGMEIARGTTGNLVGGTVAGAGNLLSGNTGFGVGLFQEGTTGNLVQGNRIGTNAAGTAALANSSAGVGILNPPGGLVAGPESNLIGGTVAAARNIISGNSVDGVIVEQTGTKNNQVQGNYIGLDPTGTAALPNGVYGVEVAFGAQDNTVGGTAAGAGNVASGNQAGAAIFNAGTTGNAIQGNYLGTDPTGTSAIGNSIAGAAVAGGAQNNFIGGTDPGAGNVASGGLHDGILVTGTGTNNNRVEGNLIGTNAAGTAALPNAFAGVEVAFGAQSNTVSRNVISGNVRGLLIANAGTSLNLVQGNWIGTENDGLSPLANSADGVVVSFSADGNNSIGGAVVGAGNTIAFNGGNGVFADTGTADAIRGNSIFSNSGLGIDLAPPGPTLNDSGDADTGPNQLQNFPVLTSATFNGSSTTVQGQLNSTASTTFAIDVFGNPSAGATGYGEGKTWLGSTVCTTDGTGNGSFSIIVPGNDPYYTATATDPAGNTSEFSFALGPHVLEARSLTVQKEVSGVLTLFYSPACGAADHVVYAGKSPIVGAVSWTQAACGLGTSGTATFDPGSPLAGQFFYFVIVGQNPVLEGSYGKSSLGVERPEASGMGACDRAQVISTICP